MKTRGKHEMRRFLVLVSVLVVLLVIGVIAFTTWDAVSRINDAAEREKENVVQSQLDFYMESSEASSGLQMDPVITGSLNPSMMECFGQGDITPMLDFLTAIIRPMYTAEYVTYVYEGDIESSSVDEGVDVSELPTSMPGETDEIHYEILDEFSEKEGYFISIDRPFNMPGMPGAFMNLLIDRTEQIEAIDAVYDADKSDLITRQIIIGIIAIVLALLITTFGVYYLTKRYITGPIEAIADTSHQIMEGTFEGEVEVEEESDYADLQRLLQSGKKLLDKMSML
jgi:HAMP domain-containing protein/competence protein ComGC